MNRLILKIKFKSVKSFDVEIVYVDPIVLAKDGDVFISYYDTDENFIIYSTNNDDMCYTKNAFKLPCLKLYKPCQTKEITFVSEDETKKWLRSLYRTLHKWNYKSPQFKKQNETEDIPYKVTISNDFWIL